MADTTSKKYPAAASEIAELLKMKGAEEHTQPKPAGTFPARDLPVLEAEHVPHEKAPAEHGHEEHVAHEPSGSRAAGIMKAVAPYVLVFGVAILSYFFFFSKVSFDITSLFHSNVPKVSKQETMLASLKKQEAGNYQNWINQFYFDVTDPKVVDMDTDNSGNGLSNFQKYLLNLNPKAYDSLGIGMADSEALSRGVSPLTGSPLTDEQKNILDKYIDMETVMNRLALAQMQKSGQIAGASTGGAMFVSANQNPALPDPNQVDVDTSIPGRLEIKDLNVNVPVMWTEDVRNFDKDLQSGVVHYPGTALPGQMGNTYIAGHSSNYVWAKGSYNRVFSQLGNLSDNASFKITVVQKNGKNAYLYYVVTSRKEYAPTDQEQFLNYGKSTVALSTCWPVGSTQKRLVVFGELTQVVKD